MYHVHVLGCPSALFDNLQFWRNHLRTFEQTLLEDLPVAIDRIRTKRPEWVVYCGLAAHSSWEEHSTNFGDEASHVVRLAETVAEAGSRLVILSSDRVFVGPRMFHDESEPTSDNAHAQSLRAIEQAALEAHGVANRVLVVRTNVFGWSRAGNSLAEKILQALRDGRSIELSTTAFATPILASDLAELLLRSFRGRMSGIVHIGGAERTSPFRFGQELAVAAGFDPRLVRPERVESENEHTVLSRETSLGSRLVRRELDISLPLLRESVSRFADQAMSGYRDQLRVLADGVLARAA